MGNPVGAGRVCVWMHVCSHMYSRADAEAQRRKRCGFREETWLLSSHEVDRDHF